MNFKSKMKICWGCSFLIVFQVLCSLILFLSLAEALKFSLEPQDTIVPNGATAVLNCAAQGSGNGKPRISWKKDGILLSFQSDTKRNPVEDSNYFERSVLANGSLQITAVIRTRESRPDEGMYQCLATLDGIGSIVSRSAKLQAASLARIEEAPEDLTVGLGQTARFGCFAQGNPSPLVTWFKDERELTIDKSRMTVLPSGSLEITVIQSNDEGVYKCNVSNVDKFHMSSNGRLVINRTPEKDTPPVFTAVPKSQTVTSSQSVILECSAVSYPHPRITWLKDGVTIDLGILDSRFSLFGEGNLKISNIQESDKGTYQCRATNREDSADVSASLDVQVPPRVLTTATNFYAYEKEDVELPCKLYGKPIPTIQWYKNGQMIIEGDYFQIVNGNNLKILGLVSSDAGMYQCFGTNPAGNVQSSVYLRVLKPDETMPEMDLNTEPPLGQNVPPVRPGSERHPTDGPSAPRELSAVLVSTRFVTLTWKPPTNTFGNIVAYAIYYKELGSVRERVINTTKTLEEINVQGLVPNKRYTFRVVAYNEKAPGVSSREITVLTAPEVDVPGPPRSLKVWAVSPTRINAKWDPPEILNGNVQRYKVFYAEAHPVGNGGPLDKILEDFDDADDVDEDEDYLLPKTGGIQYVTTNIPEAIIDDMRTFTSYYVWIIAINQNGPGASSDQLKVTTLSDIPADTPHNVSIESASSTSFAIRWEPPPLEFRNGIVTGYKIKYKQKGKKRAETVTTDGNTQFITLSELEKGTEYQIKLAAINVNGSGPYTEWIPAATFQRDLDESNVPDKPDTLQARAMSDAITISWTPPRNTNIMIRGYTIGWGKGIPDVYTKLVDGKRRHFTIDNLRPNSDYVISLRAYNQVGDGIPIYENVRTRDTSEEEDDDDGPMMAQLPPPVGLRAIVLSSSSVVLYWTDSSLTRSQVVTDSRYYVVRYLPTDLDAIPPPQRKSMTKMINATQLNTILDDLKPSTQYEFSVKVVRNRHSSEWSLVALNTTYDLTPHSPPQDLTLLAITSEDGSRSEVVLNWQPPKISKDDDMKGYFVFYTTKPTLKEWVEEVIPDDVLTHRVEGLTPDTTYYFRMSAKHSKGLGPYTEIKSVTTPPSKKILYANNNGINKISNKPEVDVKSNQIVLYILIGLSVVFALASVLLCIYYRKKGSEASPKHSTLKKPRKPDLKPPDLWIHHDQMELKSVEKGLHRTSETPLSPSTRGSREFGDPEEKTPLQHSTNSLDKRNFMSSYLGFKEADKIQPQNQCHSLGRRKPKPIKIPVEPFFFKNDVGGGGIELRNNPVLARTSQSHFRGDSSGQSTDGHNKTYDSVASGSSAASSQHNLTMPQYGVTSDYGTHSGSSLGTLSRRTGTTGNLKSFAVPIPPGNHPPTTPQTKGGNPRPLGAVVGVVPNMGGLHSSPVKRISTSQLPINSGIPKSMSPKGFPGEESPLQKCYSTEELSQEISNLEGLMKDLNAITASEFQC